MNFGQLLQEFFRDDKIAIALLVVLVDFILGIIAAFKKPNTFRLSYVGDFLRNDVAFKLLPYFVLYAGAVVAGHSEILIPGLDMGVVAGAAYTAVMLSWVGSILGSLRELGLFTQMPNTIAGAENAAPPKD